MLKRIKYRPKNNHIFIQIAAYRDAELVPTIIDCMSRARHPENLMFSIAWQHAAEDTWDNLNSFKNNPQFKILDLDYRESRGVCWARNLLQQNYADEAWTLQLDSHHRFVPDWDVLLLTMHQQLKEMGIAKPLITGYPPSYHPQNDPQGRMQTPLKMNFDRFMPEGYIRCKPAAIDNFQALNTPLAARFYSAGFAFASGDFVRKIPHDPNFYFNGEETGITARAFTWGYDLFHPHRIITWHEYTRTGKPKQWNDDPDWSSRDQNSHLRIKKLLEMDGETPDIDFGCYDLGPVRTLEDYEQYAGLSFKRRAVQQYTLDHLPPPNPPLTGQDLEASLRSMFSYNIDIKRDRFDEQDHDFWAVIFEDDAGKPLFRKDADRAEINKMLINDPPVVKIKREFYTPRQPTRWIVWPHSVSLGWLKRIEGHL